MKSTVVSVLAMVGGAQAVCPFSSGSFYKMGDAPAVVAQAHFATPYAECDRHGKCTGGAGRQSCRTTRRRAAWTWSRRRRLTRRARPRRRSGASARSCRAPGTASAHARCARPCLSRLLACAPAHRGTYSRTRTSWRWAPRSTRPRCHARTAARRTTWSPWWRLRASCSAAASPTRPPRCAWVSTMRATLTSGPY
jgi:hypothetical protein